MRKLDLAVALVILAVGTTGAAWLLAGRGGAPASVTGDEALQEEAERGPHGGRLLRADDFEVEVLIFEAGVPPEFRVYAYRDGAPLPAAELDGHIELGRLGGVRESLALLPEGAYLRSAGPVAEPHSFDVELTVAHRGETHAFRYASYEGRTEIPRRVADAQGVEVERAGPATLVREVELTGTIQVSPERIAEVRARFPGVVTEVRLSVGDTVAKGERLASIETNESLRSVALAAPIAGTVVERHVQVGQVAGEEPLFVIADLSEVWAQLDVFGADIGVVRAGQRVRITTLDGRELAGTIDWLSPLVAHGSQSLRARVVLANPDGALRPGQFVRAHVGVERIDVPLAVRRSALQTFRGRDVVFARVGDVYEVRMLEVGRGDRERVEVLDGLAPGEEYVVAQSFLVKADIEKAGASHDH
ncbi:MAG TPA: efflux RND transporter periplasmic adaptor subunit [Gammaproteobacteria bacterium]